MRYFTPESATRTLPLVRQIVDDLLALQVDLVFRGDRIDALGRHDGLETSQAHADELADMRLSMQRDRRRVDAVLDELARLGVILHSTAGGEVDFPAMLGGREVRLCWKPGDDRVLFWHEVDEAVDLRRRVEDVSDFQLPLEQNSRS